jgi:DHA1 family bicyclomycin/chloramphenicol resistance-like MFS transporter
MLSPQSRGLIFLLGALTGLTALSIDMSLPALPTLAAVFNSDADRAALTLSMFLAGYSASQLFYGPLADRYGRRPPLMVGLVLFALGGIGCALAHSIGQLIWWRLLQGIGACAGPILARAVVRDLYERRRGIQILSYMTLVMSVAPLLAPIAGGYLLQWHWRAIFAMLAAVGLAMLAIAWAGLPETIGDAPRQPIRAMQLLRNLIDFFSRKTCAGYTLVVSFVFCGLFAYISASPFVFIEVFGVPSEDYGYFFGLTAFALMAGALLNTRLVHRVAPLRLMRYGAGLMVAAGVGIAICGGLRIGGLAGVIGPMLVYVLGMGIVMPNAVSAAMEPVPQMAGFASSLIGCLQTASGSLVGYVLGLVYDRSAVPMTMAIAASAGIVGLIVFGWLGRR